MEVTTRQPSMERRGDEYKEKIKQNAENNNTREYDFTIGDHVLLKQKKANKWSTSYELAFYIITRIDRSSIAAKTR